MRILALAILATITGLAAAPAQAQTFRGDYPVCMQLYLRDGARSIECSYSSMEQRQVQHRASPPRA
jgi:hypothetical protein